MSVVQYAVDGRVARITLNRPERGNGITRAMLTALERAVEQRRPGPRRVGVAAGRQRQGLLRGL